MCVRAKIAASPTGHPRLPSTLGHPATAGTITGFSVLQVQETPHPGPSSAVCTVEGDTEVGRLAASPLLCHWCLAHHPPSIPQRETGEASGEGQSNAWVRGTDLTATGCQSALWQQLWECSAFGSPTYHPSQAPHAWALLLLLLHSRWIEEGAWCWHCPWRWNSPTFQILGNAFTAPTPFLWKA